MDRLKRGRWAAAALLLGFAASPVPAQPALPEAPALDDYVAFAQASSPELAAADARLTAAREAVALRGSKAAMSLPRGCRLRSPRRVSRTAVGWCAKSS